MLGNGDPEKKAGAGEAIMKNHDVSMLVTIFAAFLIFIGLCWGIVKLIDARKGYTYHYDGVDITVERQSPPASDEDTPEYTSAGTPINRSFDYSGFTVVETPSSDCFSEIAYNSRRHILVVTFRDSGATYAYYDVPASVWSELRDAYSKGGYYNSDIKGHYDCEKLE